MKPLQLSREARRGHGGRNERGDRGDEHDQADGHDAAPDSVALPTQLAQRVPANVAQHPHDGVQIDLRDLGLGLGLARLLHAHVDVEVQVRLQAERRCGFLLLLLRLDPTVALGAPTAGEGERRAPAGEGREAAGGSSCPPGLRGWVFVPYVVHVSEHHPILF